MTTTNPKPTDKESLALAEEALVHATSSLKLMRHHFGRALWHHASNLVASLHEEIEHLKKQEAESRFIKAGWMKEQIERIKEQEQRE